MANPETSLLVPAQSIPVPGSISPQGRAYLAAASQRLASLNQVGQAIQPPVSSQNASAAAAVAFLSPLVQDFAGTTITLELDSGGKLYRTTPKERSGRSAQVAYFDIHGGGFTSGGGEMCQILAKLRAMDYGVEVFAVDYRLAPDNVYPDALDDCMEAYRKILAIYPAHTLVIGGSSAGGNLAAALTLRARNEGLGMPAALLLLTPFLDFTGSGDSRQTNRYLDVNLYGSAGDGASAYAANHDPKHPYLSPLFADFSRDWPPTLLSSGTRDLLLSDTVCMHRALRRAGVAAELHVSEASPHGGFMGAGAPEDAEILSECREFAYRAWGMAPA